MGKKSRRFRKRSRSKRKKNNRSRYINPMLGAIFLGLIIGGFGVLIGLTKSFDVALSFGIIGFIVGAIGGAIVGIFERLPSNTSISIRPPGGIRSYPPYGPFPLDKDDE